MKKLEIAPYTSSSVGFPVKQGTWDFLQLAFQEAIAASIIAPLSGFVSPYDPTVVYILYGCVATGSTTTSITAGAIFFNGEIYLVPAQSFSSPANGNTTVANLLTTQYLTNADPVQFTDGNNHNVHNIRTVQWAWAASGTGTISTTTASDLANMVNFATASGITPITSELTTLTGSTIPGINTSISTLNGEITTLNTEVALGSWAAIPPSTGWTNTTGRYQKDGKGRVYLGGLLTVSGSIGSIVFVLPSGYRPTQILNLMVSSLVSLTPIVAYISIDTSGNVGLQGHGSYGIGDTIYFDNVMFLNS